MKWKTAIPHRGWSTPVVLLGQVWVTTAKEDGHDFFAIGLDAETGRVLFNEKVFHSDDPEPLGNGASMNCYATPSPVIEPGRVYVHFGSFGTACLDTKTGKALWKRADLRCRHYRGPSSSLVSFEDLIILTMDGADLQYHVALDKRTGETVWKTDRSVAWNDENVPGQMARDGDLRKAHSTPLIVTAGGKPQMLSPGAKAAYGYDPRTGRELWRVEHPDYSVAPRTLFDRGVAFIVTGLSKREAGGQHQRVAVARALAPRPATLLLDEPFSSLDVALRERLVGELRVLLKSLGATALVVTHDQQDAFALADRVGLMRDGRLEQWATPYDLYHRPVSRFVAEFVGQASFLPACCGGGALQTELGPLREGDAGTACGGEVDVLLRPDDVVHDALAPLRARIVERVFRGADFLYTLELPSGRRVLAFLGCLWVQEYRRHSHFRRKNLP